MKIWLAVEYKEKSKNGTAFEVMGAFSSEKKAKKVCTKGYHGYGPLKINELLPDIAESWPGFVYPILDICSAFHECNLKKFVCNSKTCPWNIRPQ